MFEATPPGPPHAQEPWPMHAGLGVTEWAKWRYVTHVSRDVSLVCEDRARAGCLLWATSSCQWTGVHQWGLREL